MKRFIHNVKQLIIWVSFTVQLHPLFDLGRLINMRQISKPRRDLFAPYKIVTSEEVFFTFCIIISVIQFSPGHSIFGGLNSNPFSCVLRSYLIPVSLPFWSQIIVSDCGADVFLSTVSNWFVVTINSDLVGEFAFPTLIVSYSECNYVSACCSVWSTRVYRWTSRPIAEVPFVTFNCAIEVPALRCSENHCQESYTWCPESPWAFVDWWVKVLSSEPGQSRPFNGIIEQSCSPYSMLVCFVSPKSDTFDCRMLIKNWEISFVKF